MTDYSDRKQRMTDPLPGSLRTVANGEPGASEASGANHDGRGGLGFQHVGTMACSDRLLICDVEYLPPRFAGTTQGKVSLGPELEIEPGVWQVLVAFEGPTLRFVLLTHDCELDNQVPLEQAEVVATLRVDSGRITAIDPELREDLDMQTAVLEAPREQVPCMLRPLDADVDAEPRGTVIDIDAGGVFEIHAPPGQPRTALFLAIAD